MLRLVQNGIYRLDGIEKTHGCQVCISDAIFRLIACRSIFLTENGFTWIDTDTLKLYAMIVKPVQFLGLECSFYGRKDALKPRGSSVQVQRPQMLETDGDEICDYIRYRLQRSSRCRR